MQSLPLCFCGKTAQYLYFYSKIYDSGKDTIESPICVCEDPECQTRARKDLSISRGGVEGFSIKSFKQLGRMTSKAIGLFCSKKNYEINHLANPIWKKLIYSIHYVSQPSKKERLVDFLRWYRKQSEGEITIAVDLLLKELNFRLKEV